jgi:hypothetical protein
MNPSTFFKWDENDISGVAAGLPYIKVEPVSKTSHDPTPCSAFTLKQQDQVHITLTETQDKNKSKQKPKIKRRNADYNRL